MAPLSRALADRREAAHQPRAVQFVMAVEEEYLRELRRQRADAERVDRARRAAVAYLA
jgi:hypothetical protein